MHNEGAETRNHFTPETVKQIIKAILTSPHGLKWSVQGLGMLRTYLSQEVRLHIWDSALKVPNASPLHDHPWHLDSYIVAGEVRQFRYTVEFPPTPGTALAHVLKHVSKYRFATIKCGEGACTMSPAQDVWLQQMAAERYGQGETYHQHKDEIHESLPLDGTVTLVTRTFAPDRDHARVFWRGEGEFVTAEPRTATREEIEATTQKALRLWF